MKFISPIPPSVNDYLGKRVGYNPINKKPIVVVYEKQEAKRYKKYMDSVLKRAIKEYCWERTGEYDYVICEVVVYTPQKKQDSDNMFKCLLDAINKANIVYDDSMIMPRVVDIIIDNKNPRVEINLYKSDKVGLFKNMDHRSEFISLNCSQCSRYKRNCSILAKVTQNRIMEEVDIKNLKCTSLKEKKA